MYLGPAHDEGEDGEEEGLEEEEDEEDGGGGGREGGAAAPVGAHAEQQLPDAHVDGVDGDAGHVHREQHKVLLVVLPHAVVHPRACTPLSLLLPSFLVGQEERTVVVHFANAALADGAVVGSVGLDGGALGALVDDLALAQPQALDELLRRIPLLHRPLHQHLSFGSGDGEAREGRLTGLVSMVLMWAE